VWTEQVDEEAARRRLREELPDFAAGHVEAIRSGWDSHAFAIDEMWIVRVPRRHEVEAALRQEARLLSAVAGRLPSAVPTPTYVSETSPVCVVARKIDGAPATIDPRTGRELGAFLAALHGVPASSVPLPNADVATWRAAHEERRLQFEENVLPLLSAGERERARTLFTSVEFDFEPTVVHGDLGPEHVLCALDGHINGVIDWTDARLGDPAIDLAWAMHATSPKFATACATAYGGVTTELAARAAFYYRRGPWYEVLYGLETDRPDLVTRGLAGVRARL
jgi:aminoglycoside phosphotransferase (APT) family kinase protein